MRHIDLFSGIGGFAHAAQEVWGEDYTNILFCDKDRFCQAVLRRHWPKAIIYGDIRELIADTRSCRHIHGEPEKHPTVEAYETLGELTSDIHSPLLLTGGFPCQPFSHAGKRRGKGDDRFLWPAMLECIRLFRPAWVIAENVYGILSIEQGMVFEQVCTDMEKEGYEVWPFIIPACAINAPHRRDRVWFVGYSNNDAKAKKLRIQERNAAKSNRSDTDARNTKHNGLHEPEIREGVMEGSNRGQEEQIKARKPERPTEQSGCVGQFRKEGLQGYKENGECEGERIFRKSDWQEDWREVAAATCIRGVDVRLPKGLYDVSESKHRTERLKMLGNSIVPQIAMEIMKAIKENDGHER